MKQNCKYQSYQNYNEIQRAGELTEDVHSFTKLVLCTGSSAEEATINETVPSLPRAQLPLLLSITGMNWGPQLNFLRLLPEAATPSLVSGLRRTRRVLLLL